MNKYKHLEGEQLTKNNGFTYHCIVTKYDYALIEARNQQNPGEHLEIWKLRDYSKSTSLRNSFNVNFPSNEEFGYYGWSFSDKNKAVKLFGTITLDTDIKAIINESYTNIPKTNKSPLNP